MLAKETAAKAMFTLLVEVLSWIENVTVSMYLMALFSIAFWE